MLAITMRFGIASTKFHSDELVIERLGLLLYGGRFHLIKEVRTELVQRYLDNPRHSMVAISQMLGYSAPSAFTRWFSGQFGMAPQRWRGRAMGRRG
jgi:AraC-like DNA-binding protein